MQNNTNLKSNKSSKRTTSVMQASAPALAAIILVTFFGLVLGASQSATCTSGSWSISDVLISNSIEVPVGNGTTFERITALTSAGWVQMSVVRVDLSSPHVFVGPVLADDVLTSPKTVTSIAEEAGLVAAVNGDFFDIGATSAPLSFTAIDGNMIRSPRKDADFASLVIRDDGTGLIGQWRWQGVLRGPNGLTITLAGMNEISVPADLAVLYDEHWSWTKQPGSVGVSHLVIRGGVVESYSSGWPAPSPNPCDSEHMGATSNNALGGDSVADIVPDTNLYTEPNSDDEVVYVVMRGYSAQVAQSLSPGDHVSIEGALVPQESGLLSAFSGKPILVQDGAIAPGLWKHTGIQSLFSAPRTAVGLTEDGNTLIMTVVDGRLPGAKGVTLNELANIMISLGAHEALNLDGGGSSTVAIRDPFTGHVMLANRPSSGCQRRVPYAVGVWTSDAAFDAECAAPNQASVQTDVSGSQIPAFVSISVESEYMIDMIDEPTGIGDIRSPEEFERTYLGSFPSIEEAITGGPSFLAGPEVSFDTQSRLILTITLYDASGRRLNPQDVSDDVQINWEATPPKNLRGIPLPEQLWSVSDDRFSAILSASSPGRFDVTARAERVSTSGENELLAQTNLAVRALDRRNTNVPLGMQIPTTSNVGASNSMQNNLALVEDFQGPNTWIGTSSSDSVGCTVATAEIEALGCELQAPPVGQGNRLPAPSGSAVTLAYDLRSPETTRAAYIRPLCPVPLPLGTSAIGMWVFGDGGGHWLRATVRDSQGHEAPIDFPRVHWTGWRIVEATIPSTLIQPVDLCQMYIVEFKPELQSAGMIVVDKIWAVVAPNGPRPTDDDIDMISHSAPGRHVVRINATRQPLNWHNILAEFEQFKAEDDIELVVVLNGPNAVDVESLRVGEAFRDPLEAGLLLEMLKSLSDGSTSVVLLQEALSTDEFGHNMEAFIDGVRIIWRKVDPEADLQHPRGINVSN